MAFANDLRKKSDKRKGKKGVEDKTTKRRKISEDESCFFPIDRFGVEIEDLFLESSSPFTSGPGSRNHKESTFRQNLGNEPTFQTSAPLKRGRGRPLKRKPGDLNPEKFNKFWLKAFRKHALKNLPLCNFSKTEKKFWSWFYTNKGIPETGYKFKSYSFKYVKELFTNQSYYREFRSFFENSCDTTLFSRDYLRKNPEKLQKYKEYGYSELYCYNDPKYSQADLCIYENADLIDIQPLSPEVVYEDLSEDFDHHVIQDRVIDEEDYLFWISQENNLEHSEGCLFWDKDEELFDDNEEHLFANDGDYLFWVNEEDLPEGREQPSAQEQLKVIGKDSPNTSEEGLEFLDD